MAGRKLFVNDTDVDLSVTLYVRKGPDPASGDAEETHFKVRGRGGQSWQDYGNDTNIYLNGVAFVADEGTQVTEEGEFVVVRGGDYDKLLNTNDTLTFQSLDIKGLAGSNTWTR